MQAYYVNNDQTKNPGLHHEVHTADCAGGIVNKTYLGYFDNCVPAVAAARKIYSDADGCAKCCPNCHRG